MENSKYYKLIEKLKADIAKNGIDKKTNVADLKDLRELVVGENQPLLAKVIRLTFQHIEEYNTFNVAIPEDEPIDDIEATEDTEGSEATKTVEKTPEKIKINPVESLDYLFSNMNDISNKLNVSDIRDFVAELKEIAGENY